MRKITIAVAALALAIGLTGCSSFTISAPTNSAAPKVISSPAAVCNDGAAQLSIPNTKVTVPSDCAVVQLSGSNITVSAKGITTLSISGDNDKVTATTIGAATIAGSNDGITATTITTLTINGNNEAIAGYQSIGSIIVQGNNNTVTSPSTPSIQQSGQNNRIGKI